MAAPKLDMLTALGEEAIFARVAAAQTMTSISQELGCDRVTLWKWIRNGGADRMAAYRAAQVQAADIFAEEAVTILDEAVKCENSHQATIAKARSDSRKWLAERFNREVFGDKQAGVQINVDLGGLHLDALRAKGSMTLAPKPAPLLLEGEVEDDDDGESGAPAQASR